MSRAVLNITIRTTWADGFKSEVSGDALTATRKTLEALRRAGAPVNIVVPHELRDFAQRVSVQDMETATMKVGRITLDIRLMEHRP